MDDYIDFVLGRNQPKKSARSGSAKDASVDTAKTRAKARFLKSELTRAENAVSKLEASLGEIDQAMCAADTSPTHPVNRSMDDLLSRRAQIADQLGLAEAEWLKLSEQLETVESG
jgi:ATP-binding cassette subfamily F protein 3